MHVEQRYYCNPFPPALQTVAKTAPFVILPYLMPDDFTRQRRASGWERVNKISYYIGNGYIQCMAMVIIIVLVINIIFTFYIVSTYCNKYIILVINNTEIIDE